MNPSNSIQAFEALFNNAAIGIITVNDTGNIVLVNQFAQQQFGYAAAELIGQKIEILIPQKHQAHHVHHRDHYHAKAHSRPMGIGMELFGLKKDGTEFPVEVSLSQYMVDGKKFAIAFITDITIRKGAVDALRQLNANLELKVKERTETLMLALEKEKDLNELKSKFVSLASHEFRTPLSTILSSANLTSKYETTEDQPKREKHIERIISNVNNLTDILNDFLSVGKIEEGKIQIRYSEFDLQEFTSGIINEMNSVVKTGQHIIYEHKGGIFVNLDPSMVRHIFSNLISNAIKFSPIDAAILVSTAVADDGVILGVKDTGIGISKEDQQHLTERFFRGENVVNIQGTGLGLHIVRKYAELMNGTLHCISEIGNGTEFIIQFKNTESDESDFSH